jgi:hypothetical protein
VDSDQIIIPTPLNVPGIVFQVHGNRGIIMLLDAILSAQNETNRLLSLLLKNETS